jgi:hypothetical protein
MAISPNPNTLSDDVLFGSFLKTVKLQENALAIQNTQIKLACLNELATYLTSKIGILNIKVNLVQSFAKTQIAELNTNVGNVIDFSTKRLSTTDIDEFRRMMLTFYHELRHGEQLFRALQYRREYDKSRPWPAIVCKQVAIPKKGVPVKYGLLGTSFLKIPNIYKKEVPEPFPVSLAQNIWTDEFKAKFLPKDRYNFAVKMAADFYGPNDPLPELDRERERDAYNFSREGYRILSKPLTPAQSDAAWYLTAFSKVNKNGYVDPSAGDFFKRITDLNDTKFKVIPLLTSFKGKK